MASRDEKQEAQDTNEKTDITPRSDGSAETPLNAAETTSEPKPDQPEEQDGWSAYWVGG